MNTTTVLRHKNGKFIHATKELDYFCATDLEQFLGLGRINTRSMDTCKIKVLDRGGRRTQGKVFIHKEHLPRLLLRSKRNTKVTWLADILLASKFSAETSAPTPAPVSDSSKVHDKVKEVLQNFWTRMPRQACEALEEACGLVGFTRMLREEDMRLYREHMREKNSRVEIN